MRTLLFTLFLLISSAAFGQMEQSEQPLAEHMQEQRARDLFYQLRCEVCEGQTIADSNALLAKDMRVLVRDKVEAGESDKVILDYFAARYGDDILMRPPLSAHTAPLWLAPLIIMVLGGWFLVRYFRRRSHTEDL